MNTMALFSTWFARAPSARQRPSCCFSGMCACPSTRCMRPRRLPHAARHTPFPLFSHTCPRPPTASPDHLEEVSELAQGGRVEGARRGQLRVRLELGNGGARLGTVDTVLEDPEAAHRQYSAGANKNVAGGHRSVDNPESTPTPHATPKRAIGTRKRRAGGEARKARRRR